MNLFENAEHVEADLNGDELRQFKLALKVLAYEYDHSPNSRLQGIPTRSLGARIGAYLDNPMYTVSHLEQAGLASERDHHVLLTENGYQYAVKRRYYRSSSGPSSFDWKTVFYILVGLATIAGALFAFLALQK